MPKFCLPAKLRVGHEKHKVGGSSSMSSSSQSSKSASSSPNIQNVPKSQFIPLGAATGRSSSRSSSRHPGHYYHISFDSLRGTHLEFSALESLHISTVEYSRKIKEQVRAFYTFALDCRGYLSLLSPVQQAELIEDTLKEYKLLPVFGPGSKEGAEGFLKYLQTLAIDECFNIVGNLTMRQNTEDFDAWFDPELVHPQLWHAFTVKQKATAEKWEAYMSANLLANPADDKDSLWFCKASWGGYQKHSNHIDKHTYIFSYDAYHQQFLVEEPAKV